MVTSRMQLCGIPGTLQRLDPWVVRRPGHPGASHQGASSLQGIAVSTHVPKPGNGSCPANAAHVAGPGRTSHRSQSHKRTRTVMSPLAIELGTITVKFGRDEL